VLIDGGFRGVDIVKPLALSVPKVWPRIATAQKFTRSNDFRTLTSLLCNSFAPAEVSRGLMSRMRDDGAKAVALLAPAIDRRHLTTKP
jgi:hypothetical protein